MAEVTPTPARGCRGTYEDGTANIQLKCMKGLDGDGDKTFNCSTMRYFKVNCSKINVLCSSVSGAFVPAITICNQRLW